MTVGNGLVYEANGILMSVTKTRTGVKLVLRNEHTTVTTTVNMDASVAAWLSSALTSVAEETKP